MRGVTLTPGVRRGVVRYFSALPRSEANAYLAIIPSGP